MNKTNLFAAMSSVKSKHMIPVVVPFVVDARAAINSLWTHRCEFDGLYVKETSLEVFIDNKHFRFVAIGESSTEDFLRRMSGLMCPGFIVDSGVFELAGDQVGDLLTGLQCRVRTPPPEKPFNFIFV